MTDREFGRQMDRLLEQRADPDYVDPELKKQIDAGKALDEWYSRRRVVTDFKLHCYKPGQKVKWRVGMNRSEGVVVGATVVDAHGEPTYVVLSGEVVVEVGEFDLRVGWEEPDAQPVSPPNTDLIPF